MMGIVLRCVALLSVAALLASAQCAAQCVLPSVDHGHQNESQPQQGHHEGHGHHHGDHQSNPAPDHQHSNSCPDQSTHVFATEKSNTQIAPSFTTVSYALPGYEAAWFQGHPFSTRVLITHPPPRGSDPRTLTIVLRI